MASTLELLRRLTTANVEYILVGGMAAVAHGSSVVTQDADVLIRFELDTMARVLDALRDVDARERMTPQKPPVASDASQYVGYRDLYLVTSEGVLDLLGEVIGVGDYDATKTNSISLDIGGFECRVIGLDDLIACKKALGRPKDLRVVAELTLVQQEALRVK